MAKTLDEYLTCFVSKNTPQWLLKRKGIPSTLELEIEGGEYSSVGNEGLWKVVLEELQGNAYKAVWGVQFPYDSRYKEQWPKFKEITGEFKFRLYHNGSDEVLAFSDNGCGIPKENHEHIVRKGFSTFGTTGIGLTTMKEDLTELGATLSFESEVGKGTTFYIILP